VRRKNDNATLVERQILHSQSLFANVMFYCLAAMLGWSPSKLLTRYPGQILINSVTYEETK
jgi:hypothetical protein